MKINYRQAEVKDLEVLFNLAVEFSKYCADKSGDKKTFFQKGWKTYFKEEILESLNDRGCFYEIAFDDKIPVGYCVSYFCEKGYFYIIDELFVTKKYQGKGIGKKLIKNSIKNGKKYKCDLRVEVYNWNKKAIEIYKNIGYTDTSKILELK